MKNFKHAILFSLLFATPLILGRIVFSNSKDTDTRPLIFTADVHKSQAQSIPIHKPIIIIDFAFHPLNAATIKQFQKYSVSDWHRYLTSHDATGHSRSVHLWSQEHRNQILCQFTFYQFAAFREYASSLEGYNEAIVALHNNLIHDKEFAHKLDTITIRRHYTLKNFICDQVQVSKKIIQEKIESQIRAEQAALAQQKQKADVLKYEEAKKIIFSQLDDLLATVQVAQSIDNPQTIFEKNIVNRAHAIQTAAYDYKAYSQQYKISATGTALLSSIGLETDSFTQCNGNAIQHAVHKEFVLSINRAGNLFARYGHIEEISFIAQSTAEFAHVGLQYNNAGYITQAFSLSNLSNALFEYGLAVAQGVGDGVMNVGNAILHPVDTATNIAQTAATAGYYLGKILYEIHDVSGAYLDDPIVGQEKFERCQQNINAVYREISEKYKSMSGPEMVRGAVATATETWLTGKCLGAAHSFYTRAHKKTLHLITKIEQGIASAPELIASAEGLEIVIANEAAETILLSARDNVENVVRQVSPALKIMHEPIPWHNLNPALGDLKKIKEAESLLKNIPAAEKVQHPLVTLIKNGEISAGSGNLGTARGALYELEIALKLEANGEKVLEFGQKNFGNRINDSREFDIITQHKWIECKDWIWEKIKDSDISKRQKKFKDQLLTAQEHNKSFEVYSKQPITPFWKDWFEKQNITYHEGIK